MSKGGKANQKGRNKHDGQYWSVTYRMLQSPSWRSLGGSAVKLYMELRTRFHGSNNGQLFMSRDEAARLLGMSKGTVQRAFKELIAKGFIVETRQGVWRSRQASLYALTDRTLNGHLATDDWKHWRPAKTIPRYSNGTKGPPDGSTTVPRE